MKKIKALINEVIMKTNYQKMPKQLSSSKQ